MNLLFRFSSWWKKLIGFLSIVYLNTIINIQEDISIHYNKCFVIFIGIFLGAIWTSFINDFYDKELDIKSGKKTYFSEKTKQQSTTFIAVITFLILVFLYTIRYNSWAIIFYVSSLLSIFIYSSSYFRFKEKPVFDIIFDGLGTQFFPALFCFSFFQESFSVQASIYGSLWLFFAHGVRALIIHQNRDLIIDKNGGLKTFVQTANFEKYKSFILVAEIGFFLLFLVAVNRIYALLMVFISILYYEKRAYSIFRLPEKKGQRIFMYDIYVLLPLMVLIHILYVDIKYLPLLIIHVFLFHMNVISYFFSMTFKKFLSLINA